MRYVNIEDISFTNSNGETKTLHGSRTPEILSAGVKNMSKEFGRELDDLAVTIWGAGAEILAFKLREQNVDRLLCEDYNEGVISKVQIPPENY